MDCLLCYKMFIGEKEFENYNQNPQLCKKALFELFRISGSPDVQGLSEDLVLCLGCHRKLEEAGELVTQLEELQRRIDKAKIEIKQGLIDSKKVSEVMTKDFGDSMSKSTRDRLVLLKAIETARPPASDLDGIDVGYFDESSEDQQSQVQAEPENGTHDFANEREELLPIETIRLKEVKICLERVQIPPGVSTIKKNVKPNLVPSNSKGGHALRNPKPTAKNTRVEESNSEAGDGSSSKDDTEGGSKAIISSSNGSRVATKGGNQTRRAPGSLRKEFTRLENGSFQCKHCFKIIKNNLSCHILIHSPPKFKCSIQGCGKRFTQKSTRNIHVKLVHEKRKEFKCSRCGKMFSTSQHRNVHVKTVHERRKDFKCTWAGCGKDFAHRSAMNVHIKIIHERRRNFKCEVGGCDKGFGSNRDLKRHISAKHQKIAVIKKVAQVMKPKADLNPALKVKVFDYRMTPSCRRMFISERARDAHEESHAN